MKTELMDMRSGVDPEQMKIAGDMLRRGGLVAFPTETVYGLGGDALNPDSSKKIYAAKGRPSDNPLIVHIADFDALEKIAAHIPRQAKELARAFWPGPLTMIFDKSDAVPTETTGGLDTVAVRMPNHAHALALIRAGGGYVAAPSANLSGRPSPTCAKHVMDDLGGRIDAVIDGGDVGIGVESTIVDLTGSVPVILRPGFISLQMLQEVLGEVRMDPGLDESDPSVRPKAPGMKYRHYAPRAEMTIVEGELQDVTAAIDHLAAEAEAAGKRVGILASDETAAYYHHGIVRSAGTRQDEVTISQHLYRILREFDDLDTAVIYSEAFDTPQIGQAIMNRLIKSAGHHVIRV